LSTTRPALFFIRFGLLVGVNLGAGGRVLSEY
jgi:hypothetical protein